MGKGVLPRDKNNVPAMGGQDETDPDLVVPFKLTTDKELITTETEREKNVLARFVKTAVAATGYAALIDLSNITDFPHDDNGRIDISYMNIQIDRDNTATGSVKVGVVTRVDGTNGDVTYFASQTFDKTSDTHLNLVDNLHPSQIKTGVINGETTRIVSNDIETDTTGIQNDVALDSPIGAASVLPAVGDIVIKHTFGGSGTYNYNVRLMYHGQALS